MKILITIIPFLSTLISYIKAHTPCDIKSGLESPYTWKPNKIDGDLPKNYNWGNVDGVNYLTRLKNQHLPIYCGSCWSQGTTSSISDRISIMRKGAFPEIVLAPQVLMDCDLNDGGCYGGDPLSAF